MTDQGMRHAVDSRRLTQFERQLLEVRALVNGLPKALAARINDVVEQVAELRRELEATVSRVDRMAEFLNRLKEKSDG